jgi:two-component system chemotaxis sensor kinase CheA
MNELLAQFIAEARELLQEAGEDLLALERTPGDEAAVNRLFRSVHTLKGSSGLFEVQPLTQVLHTTEDMFQAVREDGLSLTPPMVDMALKAFDQVGKFIDHLDRHEALPANAGPIAKTLVIELREHFGRRPGEALRKAGEIAQTESIVLPPDLVRWFRPEALLTSAVAAAREGSINLVSYLPEPGCFFRGEDPLHLALQIPHLHALATEARLPWGEFSTLDPFACNLDIYALSSASRAELEALFRYVLEQVTITELAASALVRLTAYAKPISVFATLLQEQIELLRLEAPPEEYAGRVASATRVASNALRFSARADAARIVEAAAAESLAAGEIEPLAAALAGILDDEEPDAEELRGQQPDPGFISGSAASEMVERIPSRTLRVDQEKVDALMNLIGELVVAKNSLPFLARRAEQEFGLRDLGREIKDQYGVIDRITQEMRGAVMAIRMMPVGQVFQRFPRLVRDLSRKLGKQANLVIEGGDTEADKNVIENLFDPLLHMVRNSLDHGVEAPDERAVCGKPATATIRLLARHDADQVVIEIIDDGRGIDPEVIKRKAYERGLLDEARLAAITDDEATMLVFTAGFSTAETISDVSGRGVGMDVVRNAIERAGGRIAMTSAKGIGTTVRLSLPLSMAVSRVMTVTLDDRLFGIPMDIIHGTVKVPRAEIVRIRGSEAFVLRDRVVPLLHLARLLELPEDVSGADDVRVLVVHVGGQTIGLGITAFGEGMEVILRPLEGLLAKIVGYTGTALLGDGRVLLVLNLKDLIP